MYCDDKFLAKNEKPINDFLIGYTNQTKIANILIIDSNKPAPLAICKAHLNALFAKSVG